MAVVIAVRIGKSVLAAMATIAIAGCGGSGNSASDAKTYVRTISADAAQVQAYQVKVGLDILHNDPTALAQDAQTAHDDFVNVKTDITAAGANVADNSRLGNAEYQMDNAINELKNAMGALVAFAENPDAGTLGVAKSQLDRGITDWDQAATVLWTMAGQESEIPTLAGSAPATTNGNVSTTSATTSTSAATCPPGMATNQNGELVDASRGVYGPHCQQIATRILAKADQAQAQKEDNACGGRGPGACGQSGSSTSSQATTQSVQAQTTTPTTAPNPQSYEPVRCPNAMLTSGGQAKIGITSGPAICAQASTIISDAIAAHSAGAGHSTGGVWSLAVVGYTCSTGGDGTVMTCFRRGRGTQLSMIIGTTPTPGGYWEDPLP